MTGYVRGVRRTYYQGRLYEVRRADYLPGTVRHACSYATSRGPWWLGRSPVVWGHAR